MDPFADHRSGAPIKGGMALRAPHLTTAIDPIDADMTLWTGACFFLDLCNRINVLLATPMFFFRILVFNLVALRAHDQSTQTARPTLIDISLTVVGEACPYIGSPLFGGLYIGHGMRGIDFKMRQRISEILDRPARFRQSSLELASFR